MSQIVFACHAKACAPPPVGSGGSSGGKGAAISHIRGDIQRERKAILKELDAQGLDEMNPLRHIFQSWMGNHVAVVRNEQGHVVGGVQYDIDKQFKKISITDMRMNEKHKGHGTQTLSDIAKLGVEKKMSMVVYSSLGSAKPFYAKLGAVFRRDTSNGYWTSAAVKALAEGKPVEGGVDLTYDEWSARAFDD